MIVDELREDDLGLDSTFKGNNTTNNKITANIRVTRLMSTSKDDSGTKMLQSAKGTEIPRVPE